MSEKEEELDLDEQLYCFRGSHGPPRGDRGLRLRASNILDSRVST